MKKYPFNLLFYIFPSLKKKRYSEKDFIKVELKLKKNNLSLKEKEADANKIFEKIESLSEFKKSDNILIYWNEREEITPIDFIMRWKDTKKFILPFSKRDGAKLKEIVDIKVETIDEQISYSPILRDYNGKINLAILPGIAFDHNKDRMGYGKGFYKSILKRKRVFTIGISFDCQLIEKVPSFWKDLKMTMVITPKKTIM